MDLVTPGEGQDIWKASGNAGGPLDFHFLKAAERILEPLGILDKGFYGND